MGAPDMLQRKGSEKNASSGSSLARLTQPSVAKVLVQRLLVFARRQPLQAMAADIARLVKNMANVLSSTTGRSNPTNSRE